MSEEVNTVREKNCRPRKVLTAISAQVLLALFSEDDPMFAVATLTEEQPSFVKVIESGWPECEREGALWAAALLYAGLKQELEAAEIRKLIENGSGNGLGQRFSDSELRKASRVKR